MISAVLLIATIILSKTKKIGSLISKKVLKIVIIVEIVGIVASVGELLANKVFFDNDSYSNFFKYGFFIIFIKGCIFCLFS